MKPHHKQKKMSRIRVAAFRKRKKLENIKKHPKSYASLMYQKTVNNCTILPVEPHDIPTGGNKWYIEMRERVKAQQRQVEFREVKNEDGTTSREGNQYYAGKRKAPWYMLEKRKTYRYFTKHNKWGDHTAWFRVPSEAAEMYNRTVIKKMNLIEYCEKLTEHKYNKWLKKNPAPIAPVKDPNHPDLFEKEDQVKYKAEYEKWEKSSNSALERFRDFVVSIYDQLHIVGNRIDYKNGKIIEKTVATVKDIDGKGHDVSYPNLQENDKLYKNATKAATIAMNKDSTIIDCDLKNHKGTQKRPLIRAKRERHLAAA